MRGTASTTRFVLQGRRPAWRSSRSCCSRSSASPRRRSSSLPASCGDARPIREYASGAGSSTRFACCASRRGGLFPTVGAPPITWRAPPRHVGATSLRRRDPVAWSEPDPQPTDVTALADRVETDTRERLVNVIEVSDSELPLRPRSAQSLGRTSRWWSAAVLALAVVLVAPRRAAPAETLLPQGANRGRRRRRLGEHLVRHVRAHRGDARSACVATGGRAGLILFSDTAYQALPPGTPVTELRAVRALLPRSHGRRRPGLQPQPPRSPWTRCVQRRHADLDRP